MRDGIVRHAGAGTSRTSGRWHPGPGYGLLECSPLPHPMPLRGNEPGGPCRLEVPLLTATNHGPPRPPHTFRGTIRPPHPAPAHFHSASSWCFFTHRYYVSNQASGSAPFCPLFTQAASVIRLYNTPSYFIPLNHPLLPEMNMHGISSSRFTVDLPSFSHASLEPQGSLCIMLHAWGSSPRQCVWLSSSHGRTRFLLDTHLPIEVLRPCGLTYTPHTSNPRTDSHFRHMR